MTTSDSYEMIFSADSEQKNLYLHYSCPASRALHQHSLEDFKKPIVDIFPEYLAMMYYNTFRRMKQCSTPCSILREFPDGSVWNVEITYENRMLHFVGTRYEVPTEEGISTSSESLSYGTHAGTMLLTCVDGDYIIENMDENLESMLQMHSGDSMSAYYSRSQFIRSPKLLDAAFHRSDLSHILDVILEDSHFTHLMVFLYPLRSAKKQLILNVHALTADRFFELASGYSQFTSPRLKKPAKCCATTEADLSSPLHLTNREKEILPMLINGLSYKLIAEKLIIAPGTVKKLTSNIYRKYNVTSRSELVHLLYRNADRLFGIA